MNLPRPPLLHLVGLTGGIGAGKSEVAACWRGMGLPVIDADEVARRQAAPGGPVFDAIRDLFGPGAVAADGTLDRPYVAARVFREPSLRRALEERTHPLVLREVGHRLEGLFAASCRLAAVEAALLVETGLHASMDTVVVVTAPDSRRIERVRHRDRVSEQSVLERMAAQHRDSERLRVAHRVVVNSGSLADLRRAARALALDLWDAAERPNRDAEGVRRDR